MASAPPALADHLAELGVDARFHAAIQVLCMGKLEYIKDIAVEDLLGREDSSGARIEGPVARGIVRQLQSGPTPPSAERADECTSAATASTDEPSGMSGTDDAPWGVASMSLQRGTGEEASLVRCAVRCKPSGPKTERRRIFTALLDRSGSMKRAWPLVAEAVGCVVSDELLADPPTGCRMVSVMIITFDDEASRVYLPKSAEGLKIKLLSSDCRPRGCITNFSKAFALAGEEIKREVAAHVASGASPADVDITTLIFTDGRDTSVEPFGKPSRAADKRAREAGKAFQSLLRETGCPVYTCLAAFTEKHSPDQCQRLADKYSYIHRSEVLSEWLARDLGKIFLSTGQCSLRVLLPQGAALEEPVPAALPLDAEGCLDHHVWLRVSEAGCSEVGVAVETAGGRPASTSAVLGTASYVDDGSFEAHVYSLDLASMRLRTMARGLRGRHPSSGELEELRGRLLQSRAGVEAARDASEDCLRGSTALRSVVAGFDELSERLSYALGHFEDSQDARHIGKVAIDAILRDAAQHMPRAPSTAALVGCAEACAALPKPEALSPEGYGFAVDAASGLDAEALAGQGDALFFQLSWPAGAGVHSAVDGDELASYEAFMLRSADCTQAVKPASGDGPELTHLGLPLFVSPGHFERARVHLPDVLRHFSPDKTYVAGTSECDLFGVLGRALKPAAAAASLETLAHKARALHAILSTTAAEGRNLQEEAVAEAERFIDDPELRKNYEDLWAVAAAGLLAEGWSAARFAELGKAVADEALRRMALQVLRKKSEVECYWLVWALYGPEDASSEWLDAPLVGGAGAVRLRGAGFDPLSAHRAMIDRSAGPPAPRSEGAEAVRSILLADSPGGVPQASEWRALRSLLTAWGRLVQQAGGAGKLWEAVDGRMVKGGTTGDSTWERLFAPVPLPPKPTCLRELFDDPAAALATIASVCVDGWRKHEELVQAWWEHPGSQACQLPVCHLAALGLRAVAAERSEFARAWPIRGAACPRPREWERWGDAAEPTDEALYEEVRQSIHKRFNWMPYPIKVGLTDKNYRRKGGKFEFASRLDSYIDGLHLRTKSLHQAWLKAGRETGSPEVRAAAVAEMLLRLRWDDSDDLARAKLTRIVACIWDGLEGRRAPAKPPSSALWLDDGHEVAAPKVVAKVEAQKGPRCSANEALEALDDELQQQLEALPADLWAKMEAFADAKPQQGRFRLPAGLSPLQRKAVHMWADARGLLSKSLGVGRRRRLRLAVREASGEGVAPTEAPEDAACASEKEEEAEEEEADEEEWQEVLPTDCGEP